jgi:hypothetical protein
MERIRAFVGVEELNLTSASYTINNDGVVNEAVLEIEPSEHVILGSLVHVKKSDGSTNVFKGIVHGVEEPNVWVLSVLSNGFELVNNYVEKVYKSVSPESIVEDVVDNFTENLVYDSGLSGTSGIVIDEYVAQNYAVNVIKDMMNLLRWRFNIDQNDNCYFNKEGVFDDGKIFVNGTNFDITKWEESDENVINHVRVEAGFELPRRIEELVGVDTVFALVNRPDSSVRVLEAGVEVSPDDYKVEPEVPQIVFDVAVTDPVVEYTYRRRIIVEDENEDSINSPIGRRFQRVDAPYFVTRPDARRFAASVVSEFGFEEVSVEGVIPSLVFDLRLNELCRVVDGLRGKSVDLVIQSITFDYDEGVTRLVFGRRLFDFVNWQNGVQERIKELERRFTSDAEKTFVRSTTNKLKVSVEDLSEPLVVWSPTNSFILGHVTLGRMREDENVEVDCSDEDGTNSGVWVSDESSGLDGDQYDLNGYRLSCASFDGNTNKRFVELSGTVSGVQSLVFFIKDYADDCGLINLTSTASINLVDGDITNTGLSNAVIETEVVSGWLFVYIEFDSVNVDELLVGKVATSYFDGLMDEFMLFDKGLSSDEKSVLMLKTFYSDSVFYSDCLLWYSFDNPLLGERLVDVTSNYI